MVVSGSVSGIVLAASNCADRQDGTPKKFCHTSCGWAMRRVTASNLYGTMPHGVQYIHLF